MADGRRDENEKPREHVDRYQGLRPSVRSFLEDLRDEDITELRDAMRFQRSARTVTRFGRWLIVTAVAVFITATQLGDAFTKLMAFIFKGPVK